MVKKSEKAKHEWEFYIKYHVHRVTWLYSSILSSSVMPRSTMLMFFKLSLIFSIQIVSNSDSDSDSDSIADSDSLSWIYFIDLLLFKLSQIFFIEIVIVSESFFSFFHNKIFHVRILLLAKMSHLKYF